MPGTDTNEQKVMRIRAVFACMMAGFAVLAAVLWRVQVMHGADYERHQKRQSIRRVKLPGTRGSIYDRNGGSLAENLPSYCIAIYLEELKQSGVHSNAGMVQRVHDLLRELSGELGLPVEMTDKQIETHILRRSPLPLLAWRNVGEQVVARLVESAECARGVDVYLEPVRSYPHGQLAAHVIGYVGRADPAESDDDGLSYHYYLPEMEGRRGIEKVYDGVLRGQAGGQLIRVDASGYKYDLPGDREMLREPRLGSDLKLTLDARIQELAEEAIGDDIGAAVVLSVTNGDVLAMASRPSFDLNLFAMGISRRAWQGLSTDPHAPLINRAAAGAYPPGSVFKLAVALASLEHGDGMDASTTFQCPGYYDLGTKRLNCWNWQYGGHGTVDMRQAIEQSCNTYFCNAGNRTGYRAIRETALALGLGRKTGIDLDMERAGNLPSPRDVRNRGDIANISIGQGAVDATPLQIAGMVAAVANGGRMFRPRLLLGMRAGNEEAFRDLPPVLERNLGLAGNTLEVVRDGMFAVVNGRNGSGKRAKVDGVQVAGKTGSAQYKKAGEPKTRGWMAVYFPFERPRYAAVLMLDEAVSGGITVAPRMKELVTKIAGAQTGGPGT